MTNEAVTSEIPIIKTIRARFSENNNKVRISKRNQPTIYAIFPETDSKQETNDLNST